MYIYLYIENYYNISYSLYGIPNKVHMVAFCYSISLTYPDIKCFL